MRTLEGKNINFKPRNCAILNDVCLEALSGELLIIVGPNGAGKSTLLSVLSHEITNSESIVFFKGKEFKDWDLKTLSRQKAKFSQQYNPNIPLLVGDIVMMGRYPYFQSNPGEKDYVIIDQMLKLTDMEGFKDRNYNSLSGGEKQRIHLARVLAQMQNTEKNKLIFFDEPLNNLDIRHQYNILEVIKEFVRQGNTGILVLHDLNLAAQFADRILILKKGKVKAYGPPSEVFTQEILQETYDFPCQIFKNPLTHQPMIIFGSKINEHEMQSY